MRPRLKEQADIIIKDFIRQKVEESKSDGVVVGLSGGIDSAVVSKLCADAVGGKRVLNIFMPSSESSKSDRKDAEDFAKEFGMEFKELSIVPVVEAYSRILPSPDRKDLMGNVMTRARMIILFHHANLLNRVVMGTSNKSELLIGYFTKFGDGGADFCPIGDLYKTEVRQLAAKIGIADRLIEKVPSAGLWSGQTDEGEMGITYEELDTVLHGIELGLAEDEIVKKTGVSRKLVTMVMTKHLCSVHKRKMPLIPKIGLRTIGLDWRE